MCVTSKYKVREKMSHWYSVGPRGAGRAESIYYIVEPLAAK